MTGRKISIIHPSQSRPQKAYDRFMEWTGNAVTDVEYILSLDRDDRHTPRYRALFGDKCRIIINQNKSLIDAVNKGALVASGDIFVVNSDDMYCFPGWDQTILDAVKDKTDYVLKTFDGVQKWICTLPILDRNYYNRFGYIYNPIYFHMFCDTEMTHIADAMGKMIMRNDIVFHHDNPSYNNRKKLMDRLHFRNNATHPKGAMIYKNRVLNRFGLGLDVYKLSQEATESGHVNYLIAKCK